MYNYTYEVVDDFGCEYDTTVNFYVLPLPEIQNDTLGCNLGVQLDPAISFDGGVWSAADTSVHFQPDEFVDNPLVYTTVPGTYELIFTDNACNTTDTMFVEFPPYVYADVQDTVVCNGAEFEIIPFVHESVTSYQWSNGDSGPTTLVNAEGQYILTVSNVCHSASDTMYFGYKLCDIEAPNVVSLSSMSGNSTWFVEADGLSSFNCVIVNRWGNVMYEYDDPDGYWDATFNGKKVDEGTYFYTIKAVSEAGEELNKHGFIQVIH